MKEYLQLENASNYDISKMQDDGWKVVSVTPVKHERLTYDYLLEKEVHGKKKS